jgi:hypothetical protein
MCCWPPAAFLLLCDAAVPSPAGTTATCLTMSPKGGLGFECRSCERAGFQPFAGKTSISFWIRSNANTTSPFDSSIPKGSVSALLSLGQKYYCSVQDA